MDIQVGDFLIGPGAEASDSGYILLNQGGFIGSAFIRFKGTVPDKAFVIKQIEKFCGFAEGFILGRESYFAVNQS